MEAKLVKRGGQVSADKRWMVLPDGSSVSLVPMALADCPSGWVCLFDTANWGGRMLKWSDPGTSVDLSSFSFNDELSSWSNKGSHYANWYTDAGFVGSHCMTPHTNNAYVGSGSNDDASSFKIFNTATC